MNADQVAWKAAVRHAAILEAVEARLILAGAVTEVRQFYGLSASEVDVLLWQELHEPVWRRSVEPPPGCPHATRETVAA